MLTRQSLIDPVTVSIPHLPDSLAGLRIAHLTDLHIRRRRRRYTQIARDLRGLDVDLVALTGDYMSKPGDEAVAFEVMCELCDLLKPRLGTFGVYGNHDTIDLRQRFDQLPVTWLNNRALRPGDSLPLEIIGFEADWDTWPDAIATLESMACRDCCQNGPAPAPGTGDDQKPVRVLLSHYPQYLPTAADLGVDLMLSGHTHGGQGRLPWLGPVMNSTNLPLGLTSGLLRHCDTVAITSRGLGENLIPLRVCCPPHLPVITLRRGPLPGRMTDQIENVVPW